MRAAYAVAVVTDGQLSGLCLKGITIAEVSPESAIGGPLSLVENGDVIHVDVDARALDLQVSGADVHGRGAGEDARPADQGLGTGQSGLEDRGSAGRVEQADPVVRQCSEP